VHRRARWTGCDRQLDRQATGLSVVACAAMVSHMFVVTEEDAAAIRAAFDQGGEFSAAVELRRRFPGITDNAQARACARSIAGWTPVRLPPRPPARLRFGKGRRSREG
jgi:hypothetical protein